MVHASVADGAHVSASGATVDYVQLDRRPHPDDVFSHYDLQFLLTEGYQARV